MSDNAQISFIEHLAPTLRAGFYDITVTTDLNKGKGLTPVTVDTVKESLFVGGERFKVNPADIDSIYPPDNGAGFFEETLPHIVFRTAGLPWEREPSAPDLNAGTATESNSESLPESKSSWLALFLFDEDDPAPTPKQVPISSLVKGELADGVWFPDGFHPEPDEDAAALCAVIDISADLFKAIKPTVKDLQYLAHARKVDITFKPGYDETQNEPEHEYSVVIGNRLPRIGKESIVHLVSLEAYSPILDDDQFKQKYHTVRMVSLRSWRFSCIPSGGTFNDYLASLNGGIADKQTVTNDMPIFLHRPVESQPGIDQKIVNLIEQGYIPMEHKFRQGVKSISWYRSPLTPLPVAPFLAAPFSSADALLIYDPGIGFYDASYAAAWQLGQLLALRNKSFARAQYFWKQQATLDARKKMERTVLANTLPLLPVTDEGSTLLPKFDELVISVSNIEHPTQGEEFKKSGGLQVGAEQNLEYSANKNSEWYKVIVKYIDALKALRDVPYNYLIPDPAMLPSESLRFFHVDPNWVAALVDGAFSIGDIVKQDADRKKALLSSDELKEQHTSVEYSGFILRSSVMTIWPGMEVRAYRLDGDDTPMPFVRSERIAADVLLCIVRGTISSVEFREPPEALHFGVHDPRPTETGNGIEFDKKIRNLDSDVEIGEVKNVQTTAQGIIKMAALAEELQNQEHVSLVFGERFTTADFGYVMVQQVAAVRISLNSLSGQEA